MESLGNIQNENMEWLNSDLPRNWLWKYLVRTVPMCLPAIIVGVALLWVNEPAWYYSLVFTAVAFLAFSSTLAFINYTPLRKYKLIRDISLFAQPVVFNLMRIGGIILMVGGIIGVPYSLLFWLKPIDFLFMLIYCLVILLGWLSIKLGTRWEEENP